MYVGTHQLCVNASAQANISRRLTKGENMLKLETSPTVFSSQCVSIRYKKNNASAPKWKDQRANL